MATLKIKNNKGEFEKVPYIIGGITQTDLNQLETNINNSINSINNNIDSKINNAVLRTGDTLTGALNFPNTTLNLFGDDCYLGDQDIAGQIAIKGNNGNTGITFLPYSGNIKQSISIDGGGTMTITGNTLRTPSIDATLTGSGQFRAVGGNYGFLIRNDGADTYFMLTDPGDPYGSWNGLRPIIINNATGRVDITGNITGNADTVDDLHAWQMGSLAANGNPNGPSHYMYCRHNMFGDGRFGLGMEQGHEVRVHSSTRAENLQGFVPRNSYSDSPYIPLTGSIPLEIGQWIDFHTSGSPNDFDGRIYIDTAADGAGLCYWNAHNASYNMNITWEILNLKNSVVNGKQAVIDAINNKLGYASGLTTEHTGADYAWWIENKITTSFENKFTNFTIHHFVYTQSTTMTLTCSEPAIFILSTGTSGGVIGNIYNYTVTCNSGTIYHKSESLVAQRTKLTATQSISDRLGSENHYIFADKNSNFTITCQYGSFDITELK